jgi:hypothetical protein
LNPSGTSGEVDSDEDDNTESLYKAGLSSEEIKLSVHNYFDFVGWCLLYHCKYGM